jgi:DUF4097 and DUF4098 domain-containing protein YvlB
LLVVVVLFIFFKLSGIKQQVVDAQESYNKSEKIAKDLVSYKKLYGNKKRVESGLQRIISQRSFASVKIKLLRGKQSIKIDAKSLTKSLLDALISKIFNGAYTIKNLTIKRIDATHASLIVEIAW